MNAAAPYFMNAMESEASAIARGLRRRNPDLLDRLIEQYQHRLFRVRFTDPYKRKAMPRGGDVYSIQT
jgi:hypothetical protein